MTPKQRAFVAEYVQDWNASAAAVRAGYTSDRPNQAGYELLTKPDIREAIEAALMARGLNASRVLEEMRRVALVDHREFFDSRGNLKRMTDLTAEQGACIASSEVIQRNLTAGDGQVDTIHKLKTWDKVRALEMLGKHLALLTEKVNISGGLELSWKGSQPADAIED